jgi:pilus assembly protein CpaD
MKRIALVLSVAATVGMAGCAGLPAEGVAPTPLTPTSRFALQVEAGVERVALAVHETGVSANQRDALNDIAWRFAAENAPTLRIEAPSGGDPVSSEMAWRIKGALEEAGVPPHRLQLLGYSAPDPRAPVLVGYDTVRAVVPTCGTTWTSLTRTGANAGQGNFGCAVNANLAAQIANPRDIVTPRTMMPADAGRRAVVLDAYRRGQQTSAATEALIAEGRVSNAVD